jgi:glycosyltransferase involved in cell wall biosynthesis
MSVDTSNGVVLATTTDLTAFNASSLHFLGLAQALHALGQSVTILAPRPRGALTVELDAAIRQSFTPNVRGLPRAAAIGLMGPALRRLAPKQKLYVRSGTGTFGLVKAARALGFNRIVVESNGWFEDDLSVLGKSKPWQVLARHLQVAEAGAADRLRVVTRGLGALFEANGISPAKIDHIGNGTSLELFKPGDRAAARHALGISSDAEVLVFVGNLWPAIDLPVVFDAMELLSATRPKLQFVIVGDGVSRCKFEAVSGPSTVRWLGSLSQSGANDAIAAADVAIAPFVSARNERIGLSPLKLYDYAAAGRVVIATALPGIVDLAGQPWLHLAKPHDARSYAYAIVNALDCGRRAAEISARAYAVANFGWDSVARQVANLF